MLGLGSRGRDYRGEQRQPAAGSIVWSRPESSPADDHPRGGGEAQPPGQRPASVVNTAFVVTSDSRSVT